jgi:hypothetical protein
MLFWGPFKEPLILELECSDSLGTNLGWINSWILNTIHPTIQALVRHTYIHIYRQMISRDWSLHKHNNFSWILHKWERKMCDFIEWMRVTHNKIIDQKLTACAFHILYTYYTIRHTCIEFSKILNVVFMAINYLIKKYTTSQ